MHTIEFVEIPAPTVETDGDDCVTFTCEICADTVDDGTVWVSGFQFDPDNETVAEFAVSVYFTGNDQYETHWHKAHGS